MWLKAVSSEEYLSHPVWDCLDTNRSSSIELLRWTKNVRFHRHECF
jgi:hypothetical protein